MRHMQGKETAQVRQFQYSPAGKSGAKQISACIHIIVIVDLITAIAITVSLYCIKLN